MMCVRYTVVALFAVLAGSVVATAPTLAAQTPAAAQPNKDGPKFVELPCSATFGSASSIRKEEVRCGTVTVPQNRKNPHDPRLLSVVLPVVIYALPGVKGTPMFFIAGGPGESAIEGVQQLFLKTTTGQLAVRERPIIAFERRGHAAVVERGNPELGTVTFQASGRRENTIGPIKDSLVKRMKELRAQGVDPANFTTAESVEDIADVAKALNINKLVLFGVSYGTHESLRFMRSHPEMVEAAVLDGVAPPSATQLLDSTYLTSKGRAIIGNIVAECKADPQCASEYDDLPAAVAALGSSVPLRRTAELGAPGDWRTLEVSGSAVLSVLGVASTSEEVLTNVPRIIVDFVGRDTLKGDLSPRVLFAAAMDPSLLAGNRQSMTLAYLIALCGDRPQGEPRAGDRRLCDVLGVPFGGNAITEPVQSDIPTLLISSGYDAQTPADLADSAARTLTHSQRAHFPRTGHVAFARPMVMACVAVIVESFLLRPEQIPPTGCISGVAPAFAPRGK